MVYIAVCLVTECPAGFLRRAWLECAPAFLKSFESVLLVIVSFSVWKASRFLVQ